MARRPDAPPGPSDPEGGERPVPPPRPVGASSRAGSKGDRGRAKSRSPRRGRDPDATVEGEKRKPISVRSIATPGVPSLPEPDIGEVALSVDGIEWIARVLGRSGRARTGSTPLLLVGFWPADSSDPDPVREAFVVAEALASVTPEALQVAWSRSRPVTASVDGPTAKDP